MSLLPLPASTRLRLRLGRAERRAGSAPCRPAAVWAADASRRRSARTRAAVRADRVVVPGQVPEQAARLPCVVDARLPIAEEARALGEVARICGAARRPWPGRPLAGLVAALRRSCPVPRPRRDAEVQQWPELIEEVERVRLDVGVVEKALEAGEAGVAAVRVGARRGAVRPLARHGLVAVQAGERRVPAQLLIEHLDPSVGLAGLLAQVVAGARVLLAGVPRIRGALEELGDLVRGGVRLRAGLVERGDLVLAAGAAPSCRRGRRRRAR